MSSSVYESFPNDLQIENIEIYADLINESLYKNGGGAGGNLKLQRTANSDKRRKIFKEIKRNLLKCYLKNFIIYSVIIKDFVLSLDPLNKEEVPFFILDDVIMNFFSIFNKIILSSIIETYKNKFIESLLENEKMRKLKNLELII